MMVHDKQNKTVTLTQNTAIGVSLGFLIVLGTMLMTVTTAFVDVKNQVGQNKLDIAQLQEDTNKLEIETINAKVEFSKIQAQLTSIETNIIEIKERLPR